MSQIIKLNDKRQNSISDESLLLVNLAQVLLEVVRQHGAQTTMTALVGMIQDAQKTIRRERSQEISKRDKAV